MGNARQWNEGGHAIVQAAFAVDFTSPPGPSSIRQALALHSKIEKEYPRRRETTGRLIGIPAASFKDTDEFQADVGEPVLAGFNFDSLKSNGEIERAIRLEERSFAVVRPDYRKWQETWKEVREILSLFIPILLERSNIGAFHLQYHDRFLWEGARGDFIANDIFRAETPYLAPNVFNVRDLWHSHHGFFEYFDKPEKHQLLTASQVQIVLPEAVGLPPGDGIVAEVKLNHRIIHGVDRPGGKLRPIKSVDELFAHGTGLLDAYMEEMHNKDKWLLSSLLNDEMCAKINLERLQPA